MGNASSFNEPTGRMRSLAPGPHKLAPDRFKQKADREAAKRGAKPAGDAFAGTGPAKPATGDAFRNMGGARPRAAAMRAAEPAQPVQQVKAKRAALQLVASQPEAEPVMRVEREEMRRAKPAAKASSLVLVSSSNVVAVAEAPAEPSTGSGGPGDLAMPKIDKPAPKPSRRSGSDGGGDGGAAGPPRDRIFNQDDFVAVALVTVMLILLLLYLIRPSGQGAVDDRILNTQFAATEPAAPPGPPPDPFGNAPVDLTPKSPLPPTPEAVLAEPAPAAPAAAPVVITMHAWFCTAGSNLTPATTAALDKQVADWGEKLSSRELVVTGFADTRGASDYNLALGSARASAVADYLKAKGVKVAAASGVGELPDLDDNQNCSNQRRVDVRLSDAPDEPPDRNCAPPEDFAELMCG